MNINWFAITICSFWFSAAIGSAFTKNSDPFAIALLATCVGFGYFLLK